MQYCDSLLLSSALEVVVGGEIGCYLFRRRHLCAGRLFYEFFELTGEPIDVTSVSRRVVPEACGATVSLDGYARRFTRVKETGEVRETEYLVYEAYEPMALKEMEKLIGRVKGEFEIANGKKGSVLQNCKFEPDLADGSSFHR